MTRYHSGGRDSLLAASASCESESEMELSDFDEMDYITMKSKEASTDAVHQHSDGVDVPVPVWALLGSVYGDDVNPEDKYVISPTIQTDKEDGCDIPPTIVTDILPGQRISNKVLVC